MALALGEAVGQVLEVLDGARPILVLVAVTPPHLGTLEDVGAALRVLLAPDVVVGAVAAAVIGGGRQVEAEPALALFAVTGLAATALSLAPSADGQLLASCSPAGATAALVLGDPFSCTAPALSRALGDVPAAGGLVGPPWRPSGPAEREGQRPSGPAERGGQRPSGLVAQGSGGSRLLLDGVVRADGAVGALLGPPSRVLASQGATPTGTPWVVTRSDGHVVVELGGRPAEERRRDALGDDDRSGALGLLLDDHADEVGRSELLVLPILASGPDGIRLPKRIPVGRVVRFLRTGPVEVEADLVAALAPIDGSVPGRHRGDPRGPGSGPAGLLLFPGAGRGGDADLAAALLHHPLAGLAVTAPLAPVAGVAHLHGPGSTSMVLFP